MAPSDVAPFLDRLQHIGRPLMRTVWPANSCVATTRVVIETAAGRGHTAAALSVVTLVERRETVHRLGNPAGGRLIAGNWAGHLVAIVDGHLVDLSLDQIPGMPPLTAGGAEDLLAGRAVQFASRRSTVSYFPLPDDLSYTATLDWTAPEGGVRQMIDRVRAATA
jgi:hypothetical protein